ncbi:MAG: biotin/lipoate A/B protein ligase family protein [Candidatus Hodarchaeota archaeon]
MNPYNPDYDFKQGNWHLIDDKAYPVQMGLAIDEMLFNKVDSQDYAGPNIVRFYQFSPPSVVLGNHQDIAELDLEYIKYRNLQVGRRITGGGIIIMGVPDMYSQLGVSIIIKNPPDFPSRLGKKFAILSQSIVGGLKLLGLPVQYNESTDITIFGRKISGQAIHATTSVTFFHSSILLDYDLEMMLGVVGKLKEPGAKEKYKNAYGTVMEDLSKLHFPITDKVGIMREIKQRLRLGCQLAFKAILLDQPLSPGELQAAELLLKEKHSTDDYIFNLKGTRYGSCFL